MEKDVQRGCAQDGSQLRPEDWPGYDKLRPCTRPDEWLPIEEAKRVVEEFYSHFPEEEFTPLFEKEDVVNHPNHYTSHPSGVECIQVTEHYNFCVGNAIKYLWRAGLKNNKIEDLEKARWYVDREIERIKNEEA